MQFGTAKQAAVQALHDEVCESTYHQAVQELAKEVAPPAAAAPAARPCLDLGAAFGDGEFDISDCGIFGLEAEGVEISQGERDEMAG